MDEELKSTEGYEEEQAEIASEDNTELTLTDLLIAEREENEEQPDVAADVAACEETEPAGDEDAAEAPKAAAEPVAPEENPSNKYDLTLDGEVFNCLKSDFNRMLNSLLSTMESKESEEADVTIKLKVTLKEGTAPDLNITAYSAEREILVPKFEHAISTTVQIKDKKTGFVGGSNYELFFDRKTGVYAMRPIKDAQRSIYDQDFKKNNVAPAPEAEPEGEPGNEQIELPDGEDTTFCQARDSGNCATIDDCGHCCIECEHVCQDLCPVAKEQIDMGLGADTEPPTALDDPDAPYCNAPEEQEYDPSTFDPYADEEDAG